MAYREDYLNPETLAKADELDIYFQSQGQPQYTQRSSDAPQSYSLAIDDPLPAPKFLTLSDMVSIETNTKMPPQIITGVLYKGSKMIISGSSKAGKTLSLLHLGLAVSNGKPWLGHETTQGNVIYLDFELKPRMAAQRITSIIAANPGIYKQNPRFLYCGLRGQARSLEDLVHHIEDLPDFKPDMVIVDPFYKLATGADENDAGAISEVVNRMEQFSERLDCSFVYAHHFSKGNKSDTDHIDRASGSGVFARDPDAILTLTPHEEEDHLVLEATVRDFSSPPPKVVEFEWPNFVHKPDLEPKLRKPGQSKEIQRVNEKLSNALIELLKPNSIHGLNNLRKLLQDKTGESIGDKKMDKILLISKNHISVHKTENGVGNIYSYTE
ncbi:helicase RepA family protein [Opitutales bacterium]|nr:helicase RepA family protein [Opitutales bacterium]